MRSQQQRSPADECAPDEALARAHARIADLEAALGAANRKLEAERTAARSAGERDAIEQSERRFQALIEDLHLGVVVQGPRSEILLYNRRALELLGLDEDEIHGRSSFDPAWNVVREDGSPFVAEQRPVAQVLTTRAPVRGVVLGIHRPRTADRVWLLVNAEPSLDASGEVVQVVATLDDITERKLLEDSLRQAQKLDSLGLLAGGIAHDFNNLLTVITSCTELARLRVPPGSDILPDLDEVLGAAERAAALTRQLLAFARRQVVAPRRVDVAAAVRQFEHLLGRLLGGHELVIECGHGPASANIDQSQLEQVLVNLVVNARDAMPEGGRVTVRVESLAPGRAPRSLAERSTVLLSVRDHGHGIPLELRERVFEPFFTTKPVGSGTGLGLATVHGIVRQSGGEIEIESEVGRGTELRVYLPLVHDAADPVGAGGAMPSSGTGERVLVVDDEDVVRSVVTRMLADLGYRTVAVASASAALELLEAEDGGFELLFSDVVMPRMGGIELCQRVRQRWPHIKVILASGHARVEEHDSPVLADAMLSKPFTLSTLARTVRAVLGDR